MHVRAPTGTRIEQTAKLVDEVEAAIRHQVPANELEGILDNIGLPVSGINLSYNDSGISGPADSDILVSLKPNHKPTANYVRNLRLSSTALAIVLVTGAVIDPRKRSSSQTFDSMIKSGESTA
jgi:hypothetical protein